MFFSPVVWYGRPQEVSGVLYSAVFVWCNVEVLIRPPTCITEAAFCSLIRASGKYET